MGATEVQLDSKKMQVRDACNAMRLFLGTMPGERYVPSSDRSSSFIRVDLDLASQKNTNSAVGELNRNIERYALLQKDLEKEVAECLELIENQSEKDAFIAQVKSMLTPILKEAGIRIQVTNDTSLVAVDNLKPWSDIVSRLDQLATGNKLDPKTAQPVTVDREGIKNASGAVATVNSTGDLVLTQVKERAKTISSEQVKAEAEQKKAQELEVARRLVQDAERTKHQEDQATRAAAAVHETRSDLFNLIDFNLAKKVVNEGSSEKQAWYALALTLLNSNNLDEVPESQQQNLRQLHKAMKNEVMKESFLEKLHVKGTNTKTLYKAVDQYIEALDRLAYFPGAKEKFDQNFKTIPLEHSKNYIDNNNSNNNNNEKKPGLG